MNDFTITIITIIVKTQILIIPAILFYMICCLKKLNPRFLWLIHKAAAVLFLLVPVILILLTVFFSMANTKPLVSASLDVPIEWIPEVPGIGEKAYATTNTISETWLKESEEGMEIETVNIADRIVSGEEHETSVPDESFEVQRFNWPSLLNLFLYVSCFLFILLIARLIIQQFREKNLMKNSKTEIFNGYPVYLSSEVNSPFSTGFLIRKIFIPLGYNDQQKRQSVLNHEYAHLRGNHNLWSLLENLITCLYWYNPLCFQFRKHGELLKELLADDYAESLSNKFDYSRLLVEEIESLNRKNNYYLAAGFNKKKIIKERIDNLMNPIRRKPTSVIKAGGVLSLLLCIMMTAVIGCSNVDKISDPNDFSYVKISKLKELNNDFNLALGDDSEGRNILDGSGIMMAGSGKELILLLRDDENTTFNFYDSSAQIEKSIIYTAKPDEHFSYTMDAGGNILVFSIDNESQSGVLKKLLDDGSTEEILRLNDIDVRPGALIEVSDDGSLYLRNDDKLYVYRNGRKIDIDEDRGIRSMKISPEGTLYYIVWEDPNMINYIDRETHEISSINTSYENIVVSFCDDKLLVMDSKGIKEYKDNTFKGYITSSDDYPELIGLFNNDLIKIDNTIYLTSWDFNAGILYLHSLNITDEQRAKDERLPVTIQMPSHLYQSMEYAAKVYNKTQSEIKIIVSQYEDPGENYAAYSRKLSTEIIAGAGPDIIYMSNLPYEDFIEKDVLEDLSYYIERDDSFNREDFLPALTAIEKDSGLYGLALELWSNDIIFWVEDSVMEQYGYFGPYNDIPWEKMIEIAENERRTDPNGMDIFPFGIPMFDDYSMFYINKLLTINNYFLNAETGSFEEQNFRDYLEIIDYLVNGNLVKPNISGVADLSRSAEEGSIIFLYDEFGELWKDMVLKKHVFDNKKVMMVHPTFGIDDLFFRTTLLGVNSRCEHKDEAWDFLKTILTKEFQDKMFAYSIPVNKDTLMERTLFSLRDPDQISCSFSDNSGEIEYLGAAAYTDVDIVDYFLKTEKFKQVSYRVDALDDIIFEQLAPFLDGDLSADETVKIVKERVETFINE